MSSKYKIGDSRVIESRESADGVTIRRRRETAARPTPTNSVLA